MTEPPDDLGRAYRGRWFVRVVALSAIPCLIGGGLFEMLRPNNGPELVRLGWLLLPVPVFGVVVVTWWVLAEVRLRRRRGEIRALVERRRADRRAARTKPAGTTMASGTSLVDAAGGSTVQDDTTVA